ncbi:hypothetical protein [Streptomyces sp. NPDC127039]|uniref:hypothetical protein n=1 Tax=Streptomyces sp. NPDC127039 TaxID=3347115 RepID=UPI00366656AB
MTYSPQDQRSPIIAVTATKGRDCWTLAIDCPYCPKEHRHGGGSGEFPEIGGYREPHCRDTYFRKHRIFDSRVLRYLPQYQLAPADADIDWKSERAYAETLLEEAEDLVAESDSKQAVARTETGRIVNAQIRELHGLTEEIEKTTSKTRRNDAYLSSWKASRK